MRVNFLEKINKMKYGIRSIVIDKTLIKSNKLITDKNSFYSYAIKSVLKNSYGEILNAKIRIDGSGDRNFRRSFLGYLRRELNSKDKKILANCKLVDSKTNVLIQMADMIAGSINRYYDAAKTDSKTYRNIYHGRMGVPITKKSPSRAFFNHAPMLVP